MNETVEARGGAAGKLYGTYLAEVVAVKDDKRQGRVQVRLLGYDGVGQQDGPMWARVAAPLAGPSAGAFLIPSKGDEVIVHFLNGDPRLPVVAGALWNGRAQAPERFGAAGEEVDRWSLVGRKGTRIAIVEESAGATISLATPRQSQSITITEQDGGTIVVAIRGATITLDPQGVAVDARAVTVKASTVEVNAPTVSVNAMTATFSGIVKAPTVQATTVVAELYTTGAGNVW
jgi:uncharacterized protein involved in type VI secretion and phage assembly